MNEEILLKTNSEHKKIKFDPKFKIGKKIILNTIIGSISLAICSGCSTSRDEKNIVIEDDNRASSTLNISKDELNSIRSFEESSSEKSHERDCLILDIDNINQNQEIEIPEIFRSEQYIDTNGNYRFLKEKMTVKELQEIESMNFLSTRKEMDYNWLNYCTNIKSLSFMSKDGFESLKVVHGKNLPNLQELGLYSAVDDITPNFENSFIYELENLKKLKLDSNEIKLSKLKHPEKIEELRILVNQYSRFDIDDLNDYTNLKKLSIDGEVYDIPICFSSSDIDLLKKRNIEVSLEGFYDEEKEIVTNDLNRINEKLDQIVRELNISDNASDQEKLNAILLYVLKNCTYDQDVIDGKLTNLEEKEKFYLKGYLYGALESDTQICGNYAALTQALAKRVGLKSFVISAPSHNYNIVEQDGIYYLVDSTWLDGKSVYSFEEVVNQTENGTEISYVGKNYSAEEIMEEGIQEKIESLQWYKENPEDYIYDYENDINHYAYNFPSEIDLEENTRRINDEKSKSNLEESRNSSKKDSLDNKQNQINSSNQNEEKPHIIESEEFDKKEFNIFIDGKKYIIPACAFIGILAGLGIAKAISKRKRERNNNKNNIFKDDDYRDF